MVRKLNKDDLLAIIDLRSKYFLLEDKYFEVLGHISNDKLLYILENHFVFGKFFDNKLIGMSCYVTNYVSESINTYDSLSEYNNKLEFYNKLSFNDSNTAGLTSDLIDIDYRKLGYFTELNSFRDEHLSDNGFKNKVILKNNILVNDINNLLKNGWKIGFEFTRIRNNKKVKFSLLYLS